jgi:hypothetical protein
MRPLILFALFSELLTGVSCQKSPITTSACRVSASRNRLLHGRPAKGGAQISVDDPAVAKRVALHILHCIESC